MPRTLGKSNYRILLRRRIRQFGSYEAAMGFLLPFKSDPIAMLDLRALLDASRDGVRIGRLSDDEVLSGVAKLLWSRELFVTSDGVLYGGAATQNKDESETTQATTVRPVRTPKTWIEIELIDEDGKPVPSEPFRIELSDGRVVNGRLDSSGRARFGNIDPGTCEVSFPGIDAPEWERSS